MNGNIVTTQKTGIKGDAVQIDLASGAELPGSIPELEELFRNCFKNNQVNLTINMQNIKLPPTRFIALLIEITNQARRLGGFVKLINVSNSARNNLVTFSPMTYLAIESEEEFALQDFGEDLQQESIHINGKLQTESNEKKNIELKLEQDAPSPETDLTVFENIDVERYKTQSKVEKLYSICDFVIERAKKAGFNKKELSKIKVTVYEACLNVVEHAYYSRSDKNLIEVSVGKDDGKFIIMIGDWGKGFKFDPNKKYDVRQAVKDRKTGGFGLHIIKRSVDDVYYKADSMAGNKLILVKNLNPKNKSKKKK